MKKINLQVFALTLLFLLGPAALWGDVEFTSLNLYQDNRLLFTAETESPVFGRFDTLLLSDITEMDLQQLTYFPEKTVMLHLSDQLQIQNRFGVFRTDSDLRNIQPIELYSSFIQGGDISSGKISPQGSSPDGRYLLYSENRTASFGKLILYDTLREKEYPIADNVELNLTGQQVSWSPDSGYFIYSKNNELYYYSIEQIKNDRVIHDSYRKIGTGTVKNTSWSAFSDLYYAYGNLIYRIKAGELFTRSLYSDLLKIGEIAGKIPFDYNQSFDSFRISPDGRKILFNKSGRNLFLFYLKSDEFRSTETVQSLPFLNLPEGDQLKKIVWDTSDLITLLIENQISGESRIYRIDLSQTDSSPVFEKQEISGVFDMVIQDDERFLALLTDSGVTVVDYRTWKQVYQIEHKDPLHLIWKDESTVIISGKWKTEAVTLSSTGKRELIALSQPGEFSFTGSAGDVSVFVDDQYYVWESSSSSWKESESREPLEASTFSDKFRVYSQDLTTGYYRNLVMVRDLEGYETTPLFDAPSAHYEEFPENEGNIDFTVFNHGSRIRRREVSLIFNAIDSDEGLIEILQVLNEFNLKATFFINGEFIKRNPLSTKLIADSGHEVGSLFHVYFDLTDSRYRIDEDFIRKGLGRNEDDYFNLTGEELSLLWHSPYYAANTDILAAAAKSRYSYIGRDFDTLDWVSRDEQAMGLYLSSHQIIEKIIEQKMPGSVIPIRIGRREGDRDDYLFQYLDILVNSLISLGYEIVPVSTLVEHAR